MVAADVGVSIQSDQTSLSLPLRSVSLISILCSIRLISSDRSISDVVERGNVCVQLEFVESKLRFQVIIFLLILEASMSSPVTHQSEVHVWTLPDHLSDRGGRVLRGG